MAAIPLLTDNSVCSEDEFNTEEKMVGWSTRKPLLSKENIGYAVLCCCLIAVMTGLSVGVAVVTILSWHNRADSCLQKSTAPSPLTRDLEITYHTQQFNGSFMEENVYRRKASPEVDEAWEALGVNYRSVLVPQRVGGDVGLTADHVQVNSRYGGGYPANVEGLHHLHCANLVRQALYYNIDYYREKGEGAFQNEDHIVRLHVSHCLDIIRQQLMCTVDIGVLGQVWYQTPGQEYPSAFVDFNTKHVCRNYDDIRRWAEERQMPAETPTDFLQPPRPGDRIYDHVP